MVDFSRLNRYRADLKRNKEKRNELDAKIKELERKCREEESTTIRDIVHEANMTPEDLAELFGMNGAEKLAAINRDSEINGNIESEVESTDDEEDD